jgi:Fibronectin type III domain
MILTTRVIGMSRVQHAVLAVILSQSVAVPPIILAAEQDVPRRHNLIHRSAGESADLPATIQGTIVQSPGAESVLPNIPLPPRRTLTKRSAIASTTAPASSSKTADAPLTSAFTAGQVMQMTADTAKGIATATAPLAKAIITPLPERNSTDSAAAAQTAHSPSIGTAGPHSVAAAGGGSAPSPGGSRSASHLLKNPAIAGLLQPPTPILTPPPSLPPSTSPSTPPSTPPSTSPSSNSSTGNATLTWTANTEPDLAGYKVYVGTASGLYNFPGSAFLIGRVTSYTVSNLPMGQTYFFAISAYDSAGNESVLSAETSKSLY